jgi:hypothetical protein
MLRLVCLAILPLCVPATSVQKPAPKEKIELPADVVVEAGSSRAWALMTCAVPFQRDNFKHHLLAGADLNENNVKALRTALELSENVTKRIELVMVLDKLVENGRQAQVVSMFKTIRDLKLTEADLDHFPDKTTAEFIRPLLKHSKRISKDKNGILGYDCVRYITLCRWGYGAGYLTEKEAWRRIEPIAKKLQKAYDSWVDAGEIYAIGTDIFEKHQAEKTWAAWNALKSDEASAWKSVPWDLKLIPLDRPESAKKAAETPKAPGSK